MIQSVNNGNHCGSGGGGSHVTEKQKKISTEGTLYCSFKEKSTIRIPLCTAP